MKIKSIEIEYEDGTRTRFVLELGAAELPLSAEIWKRCAVCNGTGRIDAGYCECPTGRDLLKMERRYSLENTAGGALTLPGDDLPPIPDTAK